MLRPSRHCVVLLSSLTLLFCGWASFGAHAWNASVLQGDLQLRVSQAVESFAKDPLGTQEQLQSMGPAAIPFILEFICLSDEATFKKVTRDPVLVEIIASYSNKEADDALLKLLSSECAHIRGLAASYAGRRKQQSAVPCLVNLLEDKEIYLGLAVSHGEDNEILVRDVAIEALQNITGKKLANRSSKEKQAEAWLEWWLKQKKSKGIANNQ